jgi:uncharacterized protein YdhG (YjbR/CyaY superfamily)
MSTRHTQAMAAYDSAIERAEAEFKSATAEHLLAYHLAVEPALEDCRRTLYPSFPSQWADLVGAAWAEYEAKITPHFEALQQAKERASAAP